LENLNERSLARPRPRWDDYIKIDVKEKKGGQGFDWIYLAEDGDKWRE
jgi:hypothetical protein